MPITPPEDGHAVPHADAEIATAARRKIHQLCFIGKQHPDAHGRLALADAAQADAASVAEIEQGTEVARICFQNGITEQQIQYKFHFFAIPISVTSPRTSIVPSKK